MLGLPVLAETVRGSRGELARVNTRIVKLPETGAYHN